MKKIIVTAILIIIFFLLECTLFKSLPFVSVSPNLLIILTTQAGLMMGCQSGIFVGMTSGLLCDIFFGPAIGFNALIYMYVGYVNGLFNKIFFPEDIKLPLALIAISDTCYGLAYYLILFLLRGRFNFRYYFTSIIFPEVIYTVALSLVFYPLLLRLYIFLEQSEHGGDE